MLKVDVKEIRFKVKQVRYVDVLLTEEADGPFPNEVLDLHNYIEGLKDSPIDVVDVAGYGQQWVGGSVEVIDLEVN